MKPTPFLDCREPISKTLSDLPHWDQEGRLQFLTWNLGDALPSKAVQRLSRERERWLQCHPKPWTHREEQEYFDRFTHRLDRWLDAGRGSCVLRDPQCAGIVADALMFFEGKRTRMDAFVVMPNHVHVLFQILPDIQLPKLLKSWRGFSAREINRVRFRNGPLWNRDFWDRLIRSPQHYRRVRNYIINNPEKAGLDKKSFRLWVRDKPLWETLQEEGYEVRPEWGPLC